MIENYWEDIVIFVVEFTSTNTDYKHRKTVVFNIGTRKEEVPRLVHIYFENVARVLHVDEQVEGLYLKGR